MAILQVNPKLTIEITLKLTEEEARALDALSGYGADEFLDVFYEKMGRAYLQKHETGLRTLFQTSRDVLPGILKRLDKARTEFNGNGTSNI